MTPKPTPPDQIKPVDPDKIGIYEGHAGAEPYEPNDPWYSKILAVLLVPVWHVVGWVNNLVGRRP